MTDKVDSSPDKVTLPLRRPRSQPVITGNPDLVRRFIAGESLLTALVDASINDAVLKISTCDFVDAPPLTNVFRTKEFLELLNQALATDSAFREEPALTFAEASGILLYHVQVVPLLKSSFWYRLPEGVRHNWITIANGIREEERRKWMNNRGTI